MAHYLKRYWYFAVLAPFCMMCEAVLDLFQPGFMRLIVDRGVLGIGGGGKSDFHIILANGMLMIGCTALSGIFGLLCGGFANACSQNVCNDLRKDTFRRIMALSQEQIDYFSTGSLIMRVTNDVMQIQSMIVQCVRGMVRNTVLITGGVVCLMRLDPDTGILMACIFPCAVVFMVVFIWKMTPLYSVLQRKLDGMNNLMQEKIGGIRVVKAFVQESMEKQRFCRANRELADWQLHILTRLSFMSPFLNILMNLSIVAVISIGILQAGHQQGTPGSVMAAVTYISRIFHSIMLFAFILQTISRGLASWKRIREILNCVPLIPEVHCRRDGPAEFVNGASIEFCDVTFSYPGGNGKAALKRISFQIGAGETIAVLGATGSGKSTLINLLLRFYDVTEGEILLDGENIKNYSLADLRNRISAAFQPCELFGGSVSDNIRWGKPDATEMEIRQALERGQAAEFVYSAEEGAGMAVSEKGAGLSGGQKQRLALGRALIKPGQILILDDALSALDLVTEEKIQEMLRQDYPGMTKLIITQKIVSARDADRIMVLEQGYLAGFGTHAQLIKNCLVYREIYDSQMQSRETEAALEDEYLKETGGVYYG